MAVTTVAQFAAELNRPATTLLEQLQSAGVAKQTEHDALTEGDKERLLEFLRSSHGTVAADRKKITLTRKSTSEIKQADASGRARTIQVEVRKKRVFVKRDDSTESAESPVVAVIDDVELRRREEDANRQAELLRRQEEELVQKRRLREEEEAARVAQEAALAAQQALEAAQEVEKLRQVAVVQSAPVPQEPSPEDSAVQAAQALARRLSAEAEAQKLNAKLKAQMKTAPKAKPEPAVQSALVQTQSPIISQQEETAQTAAVDSAAGSAEATATSVAEVQKPGLRG